MSFAKIAKQVNLDQQTIKKSLEWFQKESDQFYWHEQMIFILDQRTVYFRLLPGASFSMIYKTYFKQSLNYKIVHALFQQQFTSLLAFSQQHYISIATLIRYLKKVNRLFSTYGVTIDLRSKQKIQGKEAAIRHCFIEFYWQCFEEENWPFPAINEQELQNFLIQELHFDNVSYLDFLKAKVILSINLSRIQNGHSLSKDILQTQGKQLLLIDRFFGRNRNYSAFLKQFAIEEEKNFFQKEFKQLTNSTIFFKEMPHALIDEYSIVHKQSVLFHSLDRSLSIAEQKKIKRLFMQYKQLIKQLPETAFLDIKCFFFNDFYWQKQYTRMSRFLSLNTSIVDQQLLLSSYLLFFKKKQLKNQQSIKILFFTQIPNLQLQQLQRRIKATVDVPILYVNSLQDVPQLILSDLYLPQLELLYPKCFFFYGQPLFNATHFSQLCEKIEEIFYGK
ncbi:helix-turn-helix domain-containing protein [Melissococcus plutonius]|uniref:helix-turn-helix domain-containing protein n=1 Tax=Melissococcus plutonius TaxID=33970 RepID=UPI00065DD592|nr:helix-turn-helix domain-containing protein [Melissococcus plutonius]AIM25797.1 hypothetical protein MEPL_c010640 [Melissococcus plutonius S1]KMT25251.1 hypothetical protein MEPL2_2c08110 [Melissococcus plutonius]KMT26157.1 hypothetical protein MEPL3_3c00840 [Melissococcus plutonius]KMT26887.1 hypothetical protein MEPL1_4c00840 [Melissococcus plutonius]KMT28897.1 hypothetical protein MEPL4_4c00830 [Melissococcus plutonius]